MKKIAFLLPAMRMGGAEKVFINFAKSLPTSNYEYFVILNKIEGDLLNDLPKNFSVLEDKLLDFKQIVKNDLRKFKLKYLFKDLAYYFNVKFKRNKEKNYSYLVSRLPFTLGQFDTAICYVANVSTQIFSIIDRVKANKKIAWIHGETTELNDTKLFDRYYQKFDRIFCVSKVTKNHFIERFPSVKCKTDVYYNPINKEEIIEKSKVKIDFEYDNKFTITTVGRLSPEKGCDMIAKIANLLRNNKLNFIWQIIGDGSCFNQIKSELEQLSLCDSVLLLGNKINPYPYIANCDLYVQPSYEEGFSMTAAEAAILGKAIVITNVAGILEVLKEGRDCISCDVKCDAIADAIIKVYNDRLLKEQLEINVKTCDFARDEEINKILTLF